MYRPTAIGVIFLIVSAVLFVFKMISALMEKSIQIFSIEELFGLEWITKIPWDTGQQMLTSISKASLSIVLAVVGIVLLIVGIFKKE